MPAGRRKRQVRFQHTPPRGTQGIHKHEQEEILVQPPREQQQGKMTFMSTCICTSCAAKKHPEHGHWGTHRTGTDAQQAGPRLKVPSPKAGKHSQAPALPRALTLPSCQTQHYGHEHNCTIKAACNTRLLCAIWSYTPTPARAAVLPTAAPNHAARAEKCYWQAIKWPAASPHQSKQYDTQPPRCNGAGSPAGTKQTHTHVYTHIYIHTYTHSP